MADRRIQCCTEASEVRGGGSKKGTTIKWDSELDKLLKSNAAVTFNEKWVMRGSYRAFSRQFSYTDPNLNGRVFRLPHFFKGETNPTIAFRGMASSDPIAPLAVDNLFDQGLVKTGNGRTFGVARYRYTKSGERVDNITDWAVAQFVGYYFPSPLVGEIGGGRAAPAAQKTPTSNDTATSHSDADASGPHPNPPHKGEGISKDAIFAYCYAVLHDPLYREKYALNLKREFPRIPFYPNFAQWVAWGEALLKLHIDYEKVKPAKLTRVDTPAPKRAEGTHPKPKLKSLPDPSTGSGIIVIDEDTQLTGVPVQA